MNLGKLKEWILGKGLMPFREKFKGWETHDMRVFRAS